MSDPISRLQLARDEIDRCFGENYARENPQLVTVVVQSAASDWAAARIAVAIERVAEALLVEEEAVRTSGDRGNRGYPRVGAPVTVEQLLHYWPLFVVPTIVLALALSSWAR